MSALLSLSSAAVVLTVFVSVMVAFLSLSLKVATAVAQMLLPVTNCTVGAALNLVFDGKVKVTVLLGIKLPAIASLTVTLAIL